MKETKRGGKGHGESECFEGTEEAGEPTRGTPRREAKHRGTELLRGKITGTLISGIIKKEQELMRQQAHSIFLHTIVL